MAVTINWATKVINIAKVEETGMTQIQFFPNPEIWQLNVNWFRLQLKDIEDDVEGMPFTNTHIHNTEVTLGGVTFSRVFEIIAPYTVTFADGQYAVNLVGANNNIADKTNVNQVSVRASNSAGLVTVNSGSSLTAAQNTQLMKTLTVAKFLGLK